MTLHHDIDQTLPIDGWPYARVAKAQENEHTDHVMVALQPNEALRKRFEGMDVTSETKEDLHITLIYLGTIEECGGEMGRERLYRACYGTSIAWADRGALKGKVNGYGWFLNEDSHVLVALWDLPHFDDLRVLLKEQCALHGVPLLDDEHGPTPHMTLTYQDESDYSIPKIPKGKQEDTFEEIYLAWGSDEWQAVALT